MIHVAKNMVNQKCRHCGEQQLIEVPNMKMHTIQLVSISNRIHIRWTTVTHEFGRQDKRQRWTVTNNGLMGSKIEWFACFVMTGCSPKAMPE
jgi:hypothetical protein